MHVSTATKTDLWMSRLKSKKHRHPTLQKSSHRHPTLQKILSPQSNTSKNHTTAIQHFQKLFQTLLILRVSEALLCFICLGGEQSLSLSLMDRAAETPLTDNGSHMLSKRTQH